MLSIGHAFNSLKIDEYVDITDTFFNSVKQIKDNRVVQSPIFNLLEGTRAVEIGNKKLDTGLLPLSEIDYKFDTSRPQDIDSVISIINGLLRLYMSWLNNSSLPVTVLSCRYVQALLENYQGHLSECTFVNDRLPCHQAHDESSVEWKLVHIVLRSFVLSLVKVVGSSLNIAFNTLYEEEDLTTRNMDLDFLSDIQPEAILNCISESIHWINQEECIQDEKKKILNEYLELIHRMVELQLILNISIPIFEKDNNNQIKNDIVFLKLAEKNVETLSTLQLEKYKPPTGAFSKFVQYDSNNRSIPSELYMISNEECFQNLKRMIQTIHDYSMQANEIRNVNQLTQFLKFDISYKINPQYNGITRGLFQLYLIRDDKLIFGSKETLTSMCMKLLENTTCLQSMIFQPETWTSIQGTDEYIDITKNEILNKLNLLLNDIETGIYHNLSSVTNNRCRQRQIMSRGIVIWDTLQVNSEALEIELWENFGIGDRIEGLATTNDEPALPISSFTYITKLSVMLEVALGGIETNIYKIFEMSWMYWYVTYLTQIIIEFYENQVTKIIDLKIYSITTGVPKKLKKLKAGIKKQRLKQQNELNQKDVLPVLEQISQYNNNYIINSYKGMNLLSDGVRMLFIMMHALKLVDIMPNFELSSLENIYNLQMKPWSSVGVPNLPKFLQYKKSVGLEFLENISPSQKTEKIKQFLAIINQKFNESKKIYSKILKDIEEDSDSQFIGEGIKLWYRSLVKACVMYSVELNNLSKMVDGGLNKQDYKVEIEQGYNMYFPKISIQAKVQ